MNSCIALILEDGEDKKSLDGFIGNAQKKPESEEEKSLEQIKEKNTILASESKTYSEIEKIKASPLAKRIAKEKNVLLSQIKGSGPRGRIIKEDVFQFLNNDGAAKNVGIHRNLQEFYAVKNNNIRKVIARRLLESKQTVPHFYLSCEFNISKLQELRSVINQAAEFDTSGNPAYKVSVNDLIIKATAMALKKVPSANSSWSEDAILIYNNIDIAMAVAIDGGLITPIIKNADQKTIQEISFETKQLAKKAREGKLLPEEFQGGSFSISNLGMFGIDNFSAIVNPPQSCILAVARSVEKPIVEHGQIKIASMMNVTLSSDHRAVDGAVGAEFLKALRHYIESPILMLI